MFFHRSANCFATSAVQLVCLLYIIKTNFETATTIITLLTLYVFFLLSAYVTICENGDSC